jgi:hypothetical protein
MGTEALLRMSEQKSIVAEGINPGTKRSLPSGSIVNIASGAGLRGVREYCFGSFDLPWERRLRIDFLLTSPAGRL